MNIKRKDFNRYKNYYNKNAVIYPCDICKDDNAFLKRLKRYYGIDFIIVDNFSDKH
jgi:hypothetical protein